MSTRTIQPGETLSRWWPRSVASVMVIGFAVLILMSVRTYWTAPPIPMRAVAADGTVVYTGADVTAGQEVFLKYGLMDNGTIWGHGGLLQLYDVLQNGYWHARSLDCTATALARFVEWMRIWGDLIFIFSGVLPLVVALLAAYRDRLRPLANTA